MYSWFTHANATNYFRTEDILTALSKLMALDAML